MTARVKILELPERAQQLIGDGVIALAAVDQLRAIGTVAPELLDAVIAYLDDGNALGRRASDPRAGLGARRRPARAATARCSPPTSTGRRARDRRAAAGQEGRAALREAEKLHRQLDRYAYGPPPIRFTDADVDQARAAGVLIEFEHGTPIIVDRALYRELVKAAIKRTHDDLTRARRAAAAAGEDRRQRGKRPADPLADARSASATRSCAS